MPEICSALLSAEGHTDLAIVLKNMAEALAGGPSFFLLRSAAMGTKKGPASEEAGRIGFGGYSPLRRDQISV